MPLAEVNGIQLYYETAGEGPAMVFLHGADGNHLSWWQQVPAFRDRYQCITIDHRGFANSTDLAQQGATRFADDLEGLLGELGIERAALVAQSMGGRSAIGFAVRAPERVRALVMADTWGFFDWPELREQVEALRQQQSDANAPLTVRALGPRFQAENPAGTFLYRQIFDLNPPRRGQSDDPNPPTRDDVAALEVPTLFLVGSDDGLTPPEIIRRVHEIVPGSQFEEIAGCGHSVYFEAPATFNEIVGTFLAKHM